jgi:hypothetical protein
MVCDVHLVNSQHLYSVVMEIETNHVSHAVVGLRQCFYVRWDAHGLPYWETWNLESVTVHKFLSRWQWWLVQFCKYIGLLEFDMKLQSKRSGGNWFAYGFVDIKHHRSGTWLEQLPAHVCKYCRVVKFSCWALRDVPNRYPPSSSYLYY